MGIVERSDVALGLVQHQVDLLLALHRLVVEPHFVGRQHLVPSSVTILPLTETTPAVMKSSASRREQMPDWAMKRFRRISPVCFSGLNFGYDAGLSSCFL